MLPLCSQAKRTVWVSREFANPRNKLHSRVPRVLLDQLSLSRGETACSLCRGSWGGGGGGGGRFQPTNGILLAG